MQKHVQDVVQKIKKPIYKKVWFWIIVVLVVIGMAIAGADNNNTDNGNTYEKNKKVTVSVIDMSAMTEADIDAWAAEHKINITRKDEYSNTIAKGSFVSQSVAAEQNIYEGDKITLVYSLGKEPTMGEKNALKKAESYSQTMHMSKQGIYNQLTSSFEDFTKEEAQYAINNIKADWNANALKKAKSYQTTMSMSKQGIYNQLVSTFEGFTKEEAQYAIDHLDD